MKHKLINKTTGEEHICEKVTIDEFDYYVNDETVGNYHWYINTFLNKLYHSSTLKPNEDSKRVIATNNPNIDILKVVNEDEKIGVMAISYSKKFASKSKSDYTLGFIAGYIESQETHPNSDEDMIEFAEWASKYDWVFMADRNYWVNDDSRLHPKTTKELLKIWKEQRTKKLYYE